MKSQGQNKQKNTSWSKDYTRKREYIKKKKLYPQMDNTSIGEKKKTKNTGYYLKGHRE